ncbi:MAG: hypothetical protein AB1656_25290 [Candidatus Omnitrophota bacterium]
MSGKNSSDSWKEKQVPLLDVVLSNSWALQSILEYLEEIHPGARDRIWRHYLRMKQMAEAARAAGDENGAKEEKNDSEK